MFVQRPLDEETKEILSWMSEEDRRGMIALRVQMGSAIEQLKYARRWERIAIAEALKPHHILQK